MGEERWIGHSKTQEKKPKENGRKKGIQTFIKCIRVKVNVTIPLPIPMSVILPADSTKPYLKTQKPYIKSQKSHIKTM